MDEFPAPRPPGRAWLVTFTDLTALLLAFFVMLFAMSNLKADKWSDMVSALSQSLTPSSTADVSSATAPFNIGTVFRKRSVNLDYLTAVLEEALADHPLLRGAQLLRLADHALDGLTPRLGQQFGVALQFTAHQVLESGGDVPPEVLGADGVALHQAFCFHHPVAGNHFSIH